MYPQALAATSQPPRTRTTTFRRCTQTTTWRRIRLLVLPPSHLLAMLHVILGRSAQCQCQCSGTALLGIGRRRSGLFEGKGTLHGYRPRTLRSLDSMLRGLLLGQSSQTIIGTARRLSPGLLSLNLLSLASLFRLLSSSSSLLHKPLLALRLRLNHCQLLPILLLPLLQS